MNLNQSCFNLDIINRFVEHELKDCKDERAAENIKDAILNLADNMDEFPDDEWYGITLEDGTQIDANFYLGNEDHDGMEFISICLVENGETKDDDPYLVYERKQNIVKPAKEQSKQSKKEFHFWCWQNCGIPKSVVAENLDEAKEMIRKMFADRTIQDDFKDDEAPGFSYGFEIVSFNPAPKRQFAVKVQVVGINTFIVDADNEDEARKIIEDDIKKGNIDESSLTEYGDISIESCVKITEKENKEA